MLQFMGYENMKMMVNQKNEIKFDFEYLVRFLVIVIYTYLMYESPNV